MSSGEGDNSKADVIVVGAGLAGLTIGAGAAMELMP